MFTKQDTNRIKGIAILMMLMHHCFVGAYMYDGYNISFWPFSENFINNFSWYGKLCVSMFAFCSGYGLYKSFQNQSSISAWIRSRMWSVYKNYWLIFVVSAIISLLISGLPLIAYYQNGIFIGHFNLLMDFMGLSSFLGTPSLNGAWWYLSVLISTILLMPIFVTCLNKFHYWSFGLIIILPRILGVTFQGNNAPWSFMFITLLGVCFAMFNLFERISNLQIISKSSMLNDGLYFIIGCAFVAWSYIIYTTLPVETFYEINYGIVPLILIIFLWHSVIHIPFIETVLEKIGKRSGDIFYTHIFFRSFYATDFIFNQKHFLISIVVLLTLSIMASIVLDIIRKALKATIKLLRCPPSKQSYLR